MIRCLLLSILPLLAPVAMAQSVGEEAEEPTDRESKPPASAPADAGEAEGEVGRTQDGSHEEIHPESDPDWMPGELTTEGPTQEGYRWGVVPVPLLNFNRVDGIGFGAGAEIYSRLAGQSVGYRDRISVSTYWTTTGSYGSTYLQYERREAAYILLGRVTYRQWDNLNYVGVGGRDVATDYDLELAGGNHMRSPQVVINYAYQVPGSPLMVWTQGAYRFAEVEAKEGGLLDQDRPLGWEGGHYADLSVGLSILETDRWPLPNKGIRADGGVFAGATWTPDGRTTPVGGVFGEIIGWVPVVGEDFVIGLRGVYEQAWGDKPFFEQDWVHGPERDEIGYEQMITGYARTRSRGDGLAASIIELRPMLYQSRHPFWDVRLYFSVYGEAGWLFDDGDIGPWLPTVGVSPQIMWQGALQLRPFLALGWFWDGPEDTTRRAITQFGLSLKGPL